MADPDGRVTIAHLSDLHCGEQYFEPNLLERAIGEINDLEPDIVVCSGDLTSFGFKHEYLLARQYLDRIKCDSVVVVPGNHDSRNVGYVHFEEHFGDRNSVLRTKGVTVVAVDSTEPDLDHGQIGRGRYRWIEEEFAAEPSEFRIFVLHHHLLPVPGTGRERNVVLNVEIADQMSFSFAFFASRSSFAASTVSSVLRRSIMRLTSLPFLRFISA